MPQNVAKHLTPDDVPIKASELIAALESEPYEAAVVEEGDLAPCLRTVYVCVDEESHECTLSGRYGYMEDGPQYGVDPGRSEVTVLGVTFSKPVMDAEDNPVELGGRAIEYDGDWEEQDVMDAAEANITFPEYDPDDYPFDEDAVTDDDILDNLEWGGEFEAFAVNEEGAVCAFEAEDDVPGSGYEIISEEDANRLLAEKRPGIEYDFA